MNKQAGFTLFELMIAIVVIAILTAIGLPAYQSYVKKAAMTDMLQTMMPYKTAVEICALDTGSLTQCNSGASGIPATKTSNYVASVVVNAGVIKLAGQSTLTGLTATLTPTINSAQGNLNWERSCTSTPTDTALVSACEDVFKF